MQQHCSVCPQPDVIRCDHPHCSSSRQCLSIFMQMNHVLLKANWKIEAGLNNVKNVVHTLLNQDAGHSNRLQTIATASSGEQCHCLADTSSLCVNVEAYQGTTTTWWRRDGRRITTYTATCRLRSALTRPQRCFWHLI